MEVSDPGDTAVAAEQPRAPEPMAGPSAGERMRQLMAAGDRSTTPVVHPDTPEQRQDFVTNVLEPRAQQIHELCHSEIRQRC